MQSKRSKQQALLTKIRSVFTEAPYRRVLLIKPLSVDTAAFQLNMAQKQRYYNYPPYGLGLLCTQLKQQGYDVHILDLNMEVLRFSMGLKERGNLQQVLEDFWRERLHATCEEFQPDVSGITCMFTMSHRTMMHVAQALKSWNKTLPVIAGGVHVTTSPAWVLEEGSCVDLLCLNEGDLNFGRLLEIVNGSGDEDGLDYVAARCEDEILTLTEGSLPRVEDFDVTPDYLDLPLQDYWSWGEVGVFRYWLPPESTCGIVLSNRGCRGRCGFCTVWKLHDKRVRGRSVDRIVDEIESLQKQYGVTHITWLDDDLLYDHQRFLDLCEEIQKRQLHITWDATNGLITSAIARHPELVEAMVASGCIGVLLGIESGDETILKQMRKPSRLEHHLAAGDILARYPKVFSRGFLMVGYPGETIEQMLKTADLARRMDLDWYTVSLLTPLPSTDIYEKMVQEGAIDQPVSRPKTDLGNIMKFIGYGYSVRHAESRQQIERHDSNRGGGRFGFHGDPSVIPTREELNDLWLLLDYKVNYEKILSLESPLKLHKMRCFLSHVTQRMSQGHPLAHLFLGIVLQKLGRPKAADEQQNLARRFLADSPYWQQFFDAIGLESLFELSFNSVLSITPNQNPSARNRSQQIYEGV